MASGGAEIMKRSATTLLAIAVLLIGEPSLAGPIAVEATPAPLDPRDPGALRAGKLKYRGGVVLKSADQHFGGFSGLGVSADGKRMIAVSDRGRRLAADVVYGADGNLTGLANTSLDTLADLEGRPLTRKMFSDAESMSPGVEGEIIIGFERAHRLWRYMPGEVTPRPLKTPDEAAALPANSGIEALTLLADGSLFAIAEGSDDDNESLAWVSDTGGWSVMTYALKDGFRATGAATLPGGDVLVLERRYTLRTGVAARVRRLAANAITPGTHLEAELIAELRPPGTVDNMEGIEVRRAETGPDAGKTLVYLVSDDNFNPLQRTLLMMFELMD